MVPSGGQCVHAALLVTPSAVTSVTSVTAVNAELLVTASTIKNTKHELVCANITCN